MPFLSKYYEDIDLDSFVEKTVHEYSIFYEQEFDRKKIIVHTVEQREAMDYFCGRKTEDFVRASSNGNHIFYFSDESLEKETNGYHTFNQNEKIKMLRHEIGHNCFRRYRKWNGKPTFLNEWCSIYLSWQLEDKTPPKKFTLFLDYFETGWEWVYKESWYVVDLLIKEYWKPKFLKLLKETENKKNNDLFLEEFTTIYWKTLTYEYMNTLLEKHYQQWNS